MEKVRFFVLLGAVLSGCVLIAIAAESDEPEQEQGVIRHAEPIEEMGGGENVKSEEPNTPEARIAEAWREFEMASNSEARQMSDIDTEKRLRLARAAQKQTEAELTLVRLVAEQEGATQTVATVDKMLEIRMAKLAEDVNDARSARREEIMKAREERKKAMEEKRKSRREQPAP